MGSERHQRGFVLAVTLWLLAGIAVVVGLMTWWALEEVRAAANERERTEAELAMFSTAQTVIYLAASRDMTLAGIPTAPLSDEERSMRLLEDLGALKRDPVGGEIAADGTVYRGLDGSYFTVQDEAGLFPMVLPSPIALDAFLVGQGVPREQVPQLRDALLDYMDADDFRRLNGAESREYRRAQLEPPPNRRLLLPVEIERVIGWSELPEDLRRRLPELITTYYSGAANLNTAPADLLPTWVNGCPETCGALVEQRSRQPFESSYQVQALVGPRLAGDEAVDYRYLPSEMLRITLWSGTGGALRMHVRLTPLADQHAPWAVLAAYPVPRPAADEPARTPDGALFANLEAARR